MPYHPHAGTRNAGIVEVKHSVKVTKKISYTSTHFNQHLICSDLLNDEDLRLGVEKFQRGEWTSEEKTGEQEFIKSAEDEIKAKAAKKAALKRELPGSEDNGTSAKKSNLIEVPTLFI